MRLAKLRSLDEFAGKSSRFQLPDVQHQERWCNRVQHNLLYYQSNYLVIFCLSLLAFLLVDPASVVCGSGVVAIVAGATVWLTAGTEQRRAEFRNAFTRRPALSVALAAAATVALVYCLRATAIFLLAVLLPTLACLVHASLRLRNISNKVTNRLRGLRSQEDITPMELLLGWLTAIEAEGLDL